jgi:hypothetical protein
VKHHDRSRRRVGQHAVEHLLNIAWVLAAVLPAKPRAWLVRKHLVTLIHHCVSVPQPAGTTSFASHRRRLAAHGVDKPVNRHDVHLHFGRPRDVHCNAVLGGAPPCKADGTARHRNPCATLQLDRHLFCRLLDQRSAVCQKQHGPTTIVVVVVVGTSVCWTKKGVTTACLELVGC